MTQYHKREKTKRSGTGGAKRPLGDKRLAHYGGFFARPRFEKDGSEEIRENTRGKGANYKTRAKTALYANLVGKDGKISKTRIVNVVESPDNRHHAREN